MIHEVTLSLRQISICRSDLLQHRELGYATKLLLSDCFRRNCTVTYLSLTSGSKESDFVFHTVCRWSTSLKYDVQNNTILLYWTTLIWRFVLLTQAATAPWRSGWVSGIVASDGKFHKFSAKKQRGCCDSEAFRTLILLCVPSECTNDCIWGKIIFLNLLVNLFYLTSFYCSVLQMCMLDVSHQSFIGLQVSIDQTRTLRQS